MRLLLISPFDPWPPRHGTGSRITNLARELAGRHQVTVIGFREPHRSAAPASAAPFDLVHLDWGDPRPNRRLGRWISRFGFLSRNPLSATNLAVLERTVESRGIEAVIAQHVRLAPLVPWLSRLPLVWVEEGILSGLRHPALREKRNPYRTMQDWLAYLRWRRLEHWIWGHASAVVAVSEAEAAEIRKRTRGKRSVFVVPNGIDARYFAGVEPAHDGARAIFVGSRWYPNVEALHFFAREILPRIRSDVPDFQLTVAGDVRDSRELRLPATEGIELLGFVEDLRPSFAASRLFLAPLLSGHGTRLKVLEALAAGLPVVSTRKGIEGLALREGEEVVVADTPAELAAAAVRLLRDPEQALRLGAAGRARVAAEYDWGLAAGRLEVALAALPAPGRSRDLDAANPRRDRMTA